MSLPTTEISPPGSGSVSQQLAFTWNGAGDNDWHSFSSSSESYLLFLSASSTYQINAYRLTAQAASGYTFRRFEITYDNDEEGSPVAGGNVYISGYLDTVKAEKEREGHPGTIFTRLIGDYSETSGSYSYSYHVTGIKAVFDQGTPPATTYTISAYSSPQNSGTVQVGNAESGATSSQAVEAGGSVNIVATPASSWEFAGWYKNNVLVSSNATYTVSNVTAAQTFEARFTPVYTITAVALFLGKVSINGGTPSTLVSGTFHSGDVVTLDAYPNDSTVYFDRWILGSDYEHAPAIPGAGIHYQITVGNTSQTYGAVFKLYANINIYVLARGRGGSLGAKVYFNGVETQDNEDHITPINQLPVILSATATGESDKDRFIKWVLSDGSDIFAAPAISTSLSFNFSPSDPQDNETYFVCAVYEEFYPMEVSATPQGAGTATISTPPDSGDKYYLDGTSITIVATPAPGFRFVKWRVVLGSFEYDFSNSATHTFTVGSGTYESSGKYIAYFQYDGTNLLVNSASLTSPVQLVYDPATNLLVADY